MNGYLYLATDGVEDYKKFGITTNLDIRLVNYNSSQHIRPVFLRKLMYLTLILLLEMLKQNLRIN